MMADVHTEELRTLLGQSFGIAGTELVSKEQIIGALALKIERLIAGNPDQLFSLLYRLDISEHKIKQAMNANGPVALKIAELVYERQLEKIISRRRFGQERPDGDLAW
jgi:hypothetical protein